MMRKAFLLIAITTFVGCGSGSDSEPSAQDAPPEPPLSQDSLRQLYKAYRALQQDPMPTEAIREAGKLYPVDEAPLDTAFFVFRQQLLEAIEEKDVFGLLDAVSEEIEVSSAEEKGLPGFVERFQLNSAVPDTLALWEQLGAVLREGGAFVGGHQKFKAPYYYATWPEGRYATEKYVVITGSGVRLRNAPSLNGRILTTISYYPIVRLLSYEAEEVIGGKRHPWVQIELDNSTKGYVFGQFVGSPAGPRVVFERQGGKWLLARFYSG